MNGLIIMKSEELCFLKKRADLIFMTLIMRMNI